MSTRCEKCQDWGMRYVDTEDGARYVVCQCAGGHADWREAERQWVEANECTSYWRS